MRVAVVVAWRPKGFPDWKGRAHPDAQRVPVGIRYDRGAAPYTGVHLASLMPRRWDVTLVNEMVRDAEPDKLDVDAGLESLAQESLGAANKRHNQVSDYRRRIDLLHQNGVMVMSIFLLGLDGDTLDYIRRLPDLVHDLRIDVPVFSLAAPIEGTPFHQGLRDAGRLIGGVHLLY